MAESEPHSHLAASREQAVRRLEQLGLGPAEISAIALQGFNSDLFLLIYHIQSTLNEKMAADPQAAVDEEFVRDIDTVLKLHKQIERTTRTICRREASRALLGPLGIMQGEIRRIPIPNTNGG